MTKATKLSASEVDGVQYRRARGWQIALARLNNGSAMIFYVLVGMMSYLQNAGYGIAVAAAGLILTGTRILDGVIDPFLALIIDKVNLTFGKLRFFMMLGWAIRSLAVLVLFVWASDQDLGAGFFILMYVIYIIGSSTNDIAGNMIGPVMTNDPRQRPVVEVWGTVYSYLVPTIFTLISTVVILPKYGNQFTVAMLSETAVVFVIASFFFQVLAVIGVSAADKPENFRHLAARDEESQVAFRDMWQFLRHNGPFLRYVVAAVTDKLAQQVGAQAVLTTMLYGILLGNMQLGTIMGLITMLPSIVFAIVGARQTGRRGAKATTVTWTWICIALAIALIALCLLVDMRTILASLPLMIAFFGLQLVLNGSKMCVTIAGGAMRADIIDHELDRSGKYLPAVVNATYNFIDQLITSLGASITLGAVALIGYTTVMPQPTDAPTAPILIVTVVLLFVVPILGWICTLVVMPGFKLDRLEMVAVQKRIATRKAELAAADEALVTAGAISPTRDSVVADIRRHEAARASADDDRRSE